MNSKTSKLATLLGSASLLTMANAMAAQASAGADIFVIEGVMGLFDGTNGVAGQRGATADLAAHFKLPVVLVLDVSRQGEEIHIRARARSFLHHQVRNMAGTLKLVGLGSWRPGCWRDRSPICRRSGSPL